MSANFQRPSEPDAASLPLDGLSLIEQFAACEPVDAERFGTLAELPVGARLVVRCKADWRAATVSVITSECVKLLVNSPRGGTYRVRRPADATLRFDGAIPILCEEDDEATRWLAEFVSYDQRW